MTDKTPTKKPSAVDTKGKTAPRVDWEAVERDYRTNKFTLRELAAKHGCTHQAIGNQIKRRFTRCRHCRRYGRASITGNTPAQMFGDQIAQNPLQAALQPQERVSATPSYSPEPAPSANGAWYDEYFAEPDLIATPASNTPAVGKNEGKKAPSQPAATAPTGTGQPSTAQVGFAEKSLPKNATQADVQAMHDTVQREITAGRTSVSQPPLSPLLILQRKKKLERLTQDLASFSQPKETHVTQAAQAIETTQKGQDPSGAGQVNANATQTGPGPAAAPGVGPVAAGVNAPAGGILPAARGEPAVQPQSTVVQGVPQAQNKADLAPEVATQNIANKASNTPASGEISPEINKARAYGAEVFKLAGQRGSKDKRVQQYTEEQYKSYLEGYDEAEVEFKKPRTPSGDIFPTKENYKLAENSGQSATKPIPPA